MGRKVEFRNFRMGVRASEYNTQAAELMENCKSDRQGRLVPRLGSTTLLAASESPQTGLFRVKRVTDAAPISTTSPLNILYMMQLSGSGSGLLDVYNSSAGSVSSVNNFSYEPAEEYVPRWREHLYVRSAQIGNRLFLGINSASGGSNPTWVDINIPGSTPGYTVGHAVPTTPTDALVTGGSLTSGSWYGYVYTYYNPTYPIETAPSAVTTANPSGTDLKVRLTMTRTVDEQFSQVRIYRTSAQTTEALASSATKSLLATAAMTNGTSTFTADDDGTATLGAAQATSDHTKLSVDSDTVLQFLCSYKGILWGAILPRKIVFSKRTSLTSYPDWFPADNTFELPDNGEVITGLEPSPSGDGLMIFTTRRIYVMTGDTSNTIDLSIRYNEMGCLYPRTIANVNGRLFFVGNDNRIWVTDGRNPVMISSDVNTHLSHLEPSWTLVPCAIAYFNQYWLSYPSTSKLTTSSASTTITTPATDLIKGAAPHRITDASAWTLSAVKIGMWVNQVTNKARIGVITAVTDASDRIDVEDFRDLNAGGTITPAGSVAYEVFYNDRILIYDAEYDYWQGPHTGLKFSAFSWWADDLGELIGGGSDRGVLSTLETGTTDQEHINGNTQNITVKWRCVLQDVPKATSGASLETVGTVRAYMDSGTSLTCLSYKNQGTSAQETATAATPVDSTGWTAGGFSNTVNCHSWMVEVQGTTMGNIGKIEVDTT